jgi:hypothetical protein
MLKYQNVSSQWIWGIIAIYGVGCALSPSLMGLGSVLLIASAVYQANAIKTLSAALKYLVLISCLWVVFSTFNLLLREPDLRTLESLRQIPLFLVPVCAFFFQDSLNSRQKKNLVTLIAAAFCISALKSIERYLRLGESGIGWLKNPIFLGYNLLAAFVFFAGNCLVINPKWSRRISILLFLGILCTLSRIPILCAVFYLLIQLLRNLELKKTFIFIGIIGLTFWGMYHLNETTSEKMVRTFSPEDPSLVWRLKAWTYNWNLFLEHPLLGVGFENNGIDPKLQPEFQGHWKPGHLYFAHSIYLQSLADSGMVGSLLFFGFWILLGISVPATLPLLTIAGLAGLTDNIWNNSKALHPYLLFLFLSIFLLKTEANQLEIKNGT